MLSDDGLKWLGYENIGENYEPGYVYHKDNEAYKDISAFYNRLIDEAGYNRPLFTSWEKATESISKNFIEFLTIENTGIYGADNMEWLLKLGLHKIKTRTSGSNQLIADAIHNEAWGKTDEYAKSKYGENYEEISRFYNFTGIVRVYKCRL